MGSHGASEFKEDGLHVVVLADGAIREKDEVVRRTRERNELHIRFPANTITDTRDEHKHAQRQRIVWARTVRGVGTFVPFSKFGREQLWREETALATGVKRLPCANRR